MSIIGNGKIAGVPRPRPSPALPDLPAEEPTNPGSPVTVGRHKRDMKRSTLANALVVLLGGAVFSPGCLDVGTRLMGQKGRLDNVETRVTNIETEQHETRQDLKSLYHAVLTGKPQERMEKADVVHDAHLVVDGGTP